MKRIASILIALCLACTTASPPTSQAPLPLTGNAVVTGKVSLDSNPLPGTTVTLMDPALGVVSAVSDANGTYRFVNVPAGQYTVKFELSGLGATTRRATIGASGTFVVNGHLKFAAVSESITVTAEAPAMTAGIGYTASSARPAPARRTATKSPIYIEDDITEAPSYTTIKENGYIETAKETTTTFAIDVDRASYANVRRYLAANELPPADAVRIEEMINYFNYAYPQPTGVDPFSVTSEVAGCPWDLTHRLVRIGIQGRNLDEWKMSPNNLVFLIDVSGSMQSPERLPLIKSSFRILVDHLRVEDVVSIVVYAGAAGVVLPPTSGADKRTIVAALDQLQSGGSTAGGEGIELAYKTAQENFNASGNNRVILATDGDFNVGITSPGDLEKLIEEKRKSGIFLSTIGVGRDFNDATLETLADKGNGNYSYLDTPKEAEKVFKTELTGTLVTIAKDVKVQLEFDPTRVASYRQIGYENRALANKDFDDDAKDAGELGAGHSVTALYEIVPRGSSAGEIAKLRLRYTEPKGHESKLITASITDGGASAYAASADMQFAAAVAELGMLLRNSPHKGTSTYADAAALARNARGADLEGYREELLRLVDTSRALSGEGGAIASK